MFHTYLVLRRLCAALLLACTIALLATPEAHSQRRKPALEPVVGFHLAGDTTHWLSGAPFVATVTMAPEAAEKEVSAARLVAIDVDADLYLATIDMPFEGTMPITAKVTFGGYVATHEHVLSIENPVLRARKLDNTGKEIASGVDAWAALSARVGEVYDPSTEFNNPHIPAAHYQTMVMFKGIMVLDLPGLNFRNLNAENQRQLTVTPDMKPADIVTKVYWRPGGSHDMTRWVLLVCNHENMGARIPLEKKRMTVERAN